MGLVSERKKKSFQERKNTQLIFSLGALVGQTSKLNQWFQKLMLRDEACEQKGD